MDRQSLVRIPKKTILILQEFSLPLISGVVVALVWANVDHETYEALIHYTPFAAGSHYNFHFLINDLFMTVFFGIATKEITESCLPGGALNPVRKAINPLLGTAGGVLGPVAVYFAYVAITGETSIVRGWGIPTATDIALAWLVARVAFGHGHPAISFLLLLAVADDGIGLAIIAVFYPDPHHPVQPLFLLVVVLAMAIAYGLRRAGVRSFWPYVCVSGVMSWLGLYLAHLHPALALVPIVPFMPSAGRDIGLFAEEGSGLELHDTLNRFEHAFKLPVDIGLFGFGLANAGVELSDVGPATWGVLGALVIGKTVGIFGFSFVADRLGFGLPTGMTYRSLFGAGLTAALGLTVALFVAGVAFTDPVLQGAAKMGALLSAFVAPVVIVTVRLTGARRLAQAAEDERPAERGGNGADLDDGEPRSGADATEQAGAAEAPRGV